MNPSSATILPMGNGAIIEQPPIMGEAKLLTTIFTQKGHIFNRQVAFLFGIGPSRVLAYGNLKENHITKPDQSESIYSLNKLRRQSQNCY